MERADRAKLILLQIEAVQTGDFEARNTDLLVLINEVIRDAKYLAEETLELESKAA